MVGHGRKLLAIWRFEICGKSASTFRPGVGVVQRSEENLKVFKGELETEVSRLLG